MEKSIGKRIQNLMKEKNISVNQVISNLRITKQQIYNIFKKDNLDSSYIFKFSEILGVPPSEILTGKKENAVDEMKSDIARLQERISELEGQLNDKNQIIEYARRENLFAYSNLVSVLLYSRQNNGKINPEKLSDYVRNQIFDRNFLTKLLDQGLISESDYFLFISSLPKKKT